MLTSKLRKLTTLFCLLLLVSLLAWFLHIQLADRSSQVFELNHDQSSEKQTIQALISDQIFTLEIANTPEKRKTGLSEHEALGENQGMLFVFEEKNTHSFWMKGMSFPIDILWLDENKTIVHIEERVASDTFPEIFTPRQLALYAIEINSGVVGDLGFGLGDSVEFNL